MGSNIVIGLVDALRIGEEALKARIGFVFGDDPLSNDRELLEIAPYAYVIKNEKNRHLNLPDRVRLVTWSEVQAMSISELASLHTDQWGPLPATGKRAQFDEIVILQIRDGRVLRQRGIVDNLSALRQLGAVPSPRS